MTSGLGAAGSRPYQYRILLSLYETGRVSQADLGRATGIDRSDVTGALDVLCEAGFARREPDPGDKRRTLVSLTAPGRAELRRLDAVLDDAQKQFLAPLDAAERATLLRLLAALADGAGEPAQPS